MKRKRSIGEAGSLYGKKVEPAFALSAQSTTCRKVHSMHGGVRFYIGDDSQPFNLFNYTPGRAREGPKKFLKGFKPYLHFQNDLGRSNALLSDPSGKMRY